MYVFFACFSLLLCQKGAQNHYKLDARLAHECCLMHYLNTEKQTSRSVRDSRKQSLLVRKCHSHYRKQYSNTATVLVLKLPKMSPMWQRFILHVLPLKMFN